ncbi:MAG: DNA repair protein RecO [bacterium]|nr:DNA repair protein RecO [bacterium]
MALVCATGIVTRYVNYSENDRIISIFTIEQGRIDAKARGCRKPTSPLLPVAQPFVFGEFELYQGKEKCTVNQCTIQETFFPIREDIDRFAIGSAMLQLAHEAVQEREPNKPLFSLLYHALSFLAYAETEPIDLFLCYLVRYLQVIGYCPAITSCARCGRDLRADAHVYASAHAGGAVCAACNSGAREVQKTSLEAMRRMLLLEDNTMCRVRLTPALRAELTTFLTEQVGETLDYGARILAFLKQF